MKHIPPPTSLIRGVSQSHIVSMNLVSFDLEALDLNIELPYSRHRLAGMIPLAHPVSIGVAVDISVAF